MTDYKLVPFEPTSEMIEAAENAHMPFGDMELALRMAILAAPDVQGEPVAYAVFADNGNVRIWCADPIQAETLRLEYGDQVRPLYAAPQLVEQSFKSDIAETEKERRLERDIASTIEKMMGLNAQNRALVEALEGLLPFVTSDSVECRGDKCRELWCLSCWDEETVHETVKNIRAAITKADDALAAYRKGEES